MTDPFARVKDAIADTLGALLPQQSDIAQPMVDAMRHAVLGGGKVIMVAMKITSNIELYFSWGAASALGVVLLVVTMAILFAASKLVSLDQLGGKG